MKVLLVEPEYYSQFPPLGLLKLGAYHRIHGDEVALARGIQNPPLDPDIIYVTSIIFILWFGFEHPSYSPDLHLLSALMDLDEAQIP